MGATLIRKTFSKLLLSVLALAAANFAQAGVINFNTCYARCSSVNALFGDDLGILASLEYTDNGDGSVLFVLTHSFSNSYTPAEDTFISELFLNFANAPTGFTGTSSNLSSITISPDGIVNAGLNFDVDVDLKNSRPRRLLDGQTASWTFLGITESDVVGTALVHIESLPALNPQDPTASDRVKLIGTPTVVQQVPEPAGWLLLVAGMVLLRRPWQSQHC